MKVLRGMKKALLPGLAAVMVLTAAAAPSLSYFTTYVTAKGGYTLVLKNVRTETNEEVSATTKNISVKNTGENPCFARVKLVNTSDIIVTYKGEGWRDGGDGYVYYDTVLQPGETSSGLIATINLPEYSPEKPIPAGTEIDVVVITECTRALYHEDGTAYADWSQKVEEVG